MRPSPVFLALTLCLLVGLVVAYTRVSPPEVHEGFVGDGRDQSEVTISEPWRVPADARRVIEGITLVGGIDPIEVAGTLVIRDTRLKLQGRAVRLLPGGKLTLERTEVMCDRGGLVVSGGEAVVRDTTFVGCSGVSILVSGGVATLSDVAIRGGEHGLLVRGPGTVTTHGLTVVDVVFTGVGLMGATGDLSNVTVRGGAKHAGVMVSEPPSLATFEHLRVQDAGSTGVQVLRGAVRLVDPFIDTIRPERDGALPMGLYFEDAETTVVRPTIDGGRGTAVFVRRGRATLQGGRLSGLETTRIVADQQAWVRLEAMGEVSGVVASCAEGARVELVGTTVVGVSGACVGPP